MNSAHSRKYPRLKTAFNVECQLESRTFRAKASTLGGGGLFLSTEQNLGQGSELLVHFRPTRHLPEIEARVKVSYTVPGEGVGLEFIGINPDQREVLLRLIHRKGIDRRSFPRAPLAIQIECQQCMALAVARDVSGGGMFVQTKEPLPVGSRLNLRFNLEDGGSTVLVLAEVTYTVAGMGMGVLFADLAATDRQRIEAYVARSQPESEPARSG